MVSPPKLRFHQRIQQWRQTIHLTAAHALDWEIEPRLRLVWWRAQCSALICLSVQNNFTSISHWGVYAGSSNLKTLVSFGMQGPATSTQFHLWAVIGTPFITIFWAQSQAIKGFIALACFSMSSSMTWGCFPQELSQDRACRCPPFGAHTSVKLHLLCGRNGFMLYDLSRIQKRRANAVSHCHQLVTACVSRF